MLRTWSALCLIVLLSATIRAQDGPHLRDSIAAAPNDALRATYLNRLGRYYTLKPGSVASDLDSSLYFLYQGARLAKQANLTDLYLQSIYYQAFVWIDLRQPSEAVRLMPLLTERDQMVIGYFLSWHYVRRPGSYRYDLDTAAIYGARALELALRQGQIAYAGQIAETLAEAHLERVDVSSALAIVEKVAPASQVRILFQVGEHYRRRRYEHKPDLDSAMLYGLRGLELARQLKDSKAISQCAWVLAASEVEAALPMTWVRYFPLLRGGDRGFIGIWTCYESLGRGDAADTAALYARIALEAFRQMGAKSEMAAAEKALAAVGILKNTELAIQGIPPREQFRLLMDTARKCTDAGDAMDQQLSNAATGCLHRAITLAEQLKDDELLLEAWLRMAAVFCHRGQMGLSWQYFQLAIDKHHQRNDLRSVARLWDEMGRLPSASRVHFEKKAAAFKMARYYYSRLRDHSAAWNAGINEVRFLLSDSRTAEAAAILDTLARHFPPTGTADQHELYQLQALLAQQKGDQSTALRYTLASLKPAEAKNDSLQIKITGVRLAEIYADLGETDKSIETYQRSLDLHRRPGHYFHATPAFLLAQLLVSQNRAQEALAFLETAKRVHHPNDFYGTRQIDGALANCYHALGRDTEAEATYLRSIRDMHTDLVTEKISAMLQFNIGRFYFSKGQYRKAAEHLGATVRFRVDATSMGLARNAHLLLFRCDSAMGDHRSAIAHYQVYKAYSDTLFNLAKSRQISELHIQYETEKKDQSLRFQEQEIAFREKNILLLTRQGLLAKAKLKQADFEKRQIINDAQKQDLDIQLKEKNISILTQNAQIQQGRLERERLMRNVTFGSASLLLVIVGLLVHGYRLKQRHNRSLEGKQLEIGLKNQSLEKLLTEKEWLLKEIHHRVKNNLQIVMSLLNTQGAYLQNDAALVAIRDSQHRVQAISLIHKKLYQSDNVGLIYMPHYIHELVEYLSDCFGIDRRVRFFQDVAPVHLDVSQAVPLGLILNEAITNAIKYAFLSGGEGEIRVTLSPLADGSYTLTIADNGQGLPADFKPAESRSLGMSLMKGLCNDLSGQLSFHSHNGTEIQIRFVVEKFTEPDLHLQPHNAISAVIHPNLAIPSV